MSKAVYFVTRYSVVSKAQHTWQIAKNATDYDAYRSAVLAEERLARRLELFENITIPSICSQTATGVSLNWLVLVAADLPPRHLAALHGALDLASSKGLHVSVLPVAASDEEADLDRGVFAGIGQALRLRLESELANTDTDFATVRLDDDDALAAGFTSSLLPYLKPEFAGMHVSFSRGLQAVYADGALSDARVVDKPMIALGLSFINRHEDGGRFLHPEIHVHAFGNHARLSQRTPVIVDGSGLSYLRTLDSTSDLGDVTHAKNPAATEDEIASLGLSFTIAPPNGEVPTTPISKKGWFRR